MQRNKISTGKLQPFNTPSGERTAMANNDSTSPFLYRID